MARTIFLPLTWAIALFLSACYTHNFPPPEQALIHVPADIPTARIHVDSNGTLFPQLWPQLWRPDFGLLRSWPAHSLLNQAQRNPAFAPLLRSEQERQRSELRDFISDKRRLFIFIHGFDNNQADTQRPFAMMRRRLYLQAGDAIIMVHWDGFDARFFGAQVAFWWKAVANSQMAGSHAVRDILGLTSAGQQVFLISHSRGASVILSALSNPRYTDAFRAETAALSFAQGREFLSPRPLSDEPRNIHAIMMAPAIGRVDFLVADCAAAGERVPGVDCDTVRSFPRLASLDYTLNACDEVLEKIVGLPHILNPTDLGLIPRIGDRLIPEMAVRGVTMRRHRIVAPHNHDFLLYTADPEFSAMMAAVGVGSQLWPDPPRPEQCRRSEQEARDGAG